MNEKQQIFVNTKDKKLIFRELDEQTNKYKEILKTEIIIGKNGATINKKEGDGKTPKGTYDLGIIFGIKPNPGTNLEYIEIDENYYWVDDSNSKYYNKMVDIKKVEKDWESAEHLVKYQKEYQYVIEIKYNEEGKKGKGSAIFLHCIGDKNYTQGCIAIKKEAIIQIIKFLKSECKIKIV